MEYWIYGVMVKKTKNPLLQNSNTPRDKLNDFNRLI